MYQLAYISKAIAPFGSAALTELQARASAHNRLHDVTGLLLYDGLRFIQALEGREADVRAIMARIDADARHTQIDCFASGAVAARAFGAWSMDVRRVAGGIEGPAFVERVKRDVETVRDPALRAAFIGFAVLGVEMPALRRA